MGGETIISLRQAGTLDFNPFSDLKKDKWYYTTVLEATVTHNYYLDDKKVEIKWEDCK